MSDESKTPERFEVRPGSIVAERYEVCSALGSGGMGLVFLVNDRQLNNQPLALKLLHPRFAADEAVFARFRNEVLVARSLSHPNIVRTYDFGQIKEGYCYISMEYVEGESLKDLILRRKGQQQASLSAQALSFSEVIDILRQIMSGVAYAHRQGVVHRDLKPANVLLARGGEARLVDFGTARTTKVDCRLTHTGQVIGTPAYMSPELVQGQRGDKYADIYALGIMAFELVTGRLPFEANSFMEVAVKQIQDPFPDFAAAAGVPLWFEEAVKKACAKDKASRFDSVDQFMEFIERRLRPDAAQALDTAVGRTSRRIAAYGIGAAVLVLLPAAGAILYLQLPPEDRRAAVTGEPETDDVRSAQLRYLKELEESEGPETPPAAALPIAAGESAASAGPQADIIAADALDEPVAAAAAAHKMAAVPAAAAEVYEQLDETAANAADQKLTAGPQADDEPDLPPEKEDKAPLRPFAATGQDAALAALQSLDIDTPEEVQGPGSTQSAAGAPGADRVPQPGVEWGTRYLGPDIESYSGTMLGAAGSGQPAQKRVLLLNLRFKGSEISGEAFLGGLGSFSASGENFGEAQRRFKLELSSETTSVFLSGEEKQLGEGEMKTEALAGTVEDSEGKAQGTWQVVLVRRNIAAKKQLHEE